MTNNKKEAQTAEESTSKQIIEHEVQELQAYDINAFLKKRKEFITKVNAIMVEGKDYHVIQNKKSLAKGGAEKIASIFGWTATFQKDTDVAEAFNEVKGLMAFVCNLEKSTVVVGQGRGAATLMKNNGDPNKTIKMAQKSAFIDAVLRASGLSDFFTQDLGPEDEGSNYDHIKKPFNKIEWQKNNRQEFKQKNGFSQTTNYRFGGGDTRANVLIRDNYKCVVCGMTDEEHLKQWNKPLTVDHIDKNQNNNLIVNLQTLCLSCHGKKDINTELIEPQIPQHKEQILSLHKQGKTYQQIAEEVGYSIGGIWKWIQRWDLEDMNKDDFLPKVEIPKINTPIKHYSPRGTPPQFDVNNKFRKEKDKFEAYKLQIRTSRDLDELKSIGQLIELDVEVTVNMKKDLRIEYRGKLKELK